MSPSPPTLPSLHASLLNPNGHGSASGNANNNQVKVTPELSPLSRINISDSFNFFSSQTHVHQTVLVVESPAKKDESSIVGTVLGVGAITMVGAAVGAAIAWGLGGEKEKLGGKGKGGVKVRVSAGVYGTLAAEIMGTAMEPPEEEKEEEEEGVQV